MTKIYLNLDEIQKLETEADNLRDRLLIRLLFHLGCRVTEALGLEVQHIDFSAGRVTIQHLKTRVRLDCPECGRKLSRSSIFCPECGVKVEQAISKVVENRKMRTLPVDKDTLSLLKEYISRGGPVFKDGKLLIFGLARHRVWQVVSNCYKKTGLPKATGRTIESDPST